MRLLVLKFQPISVLARRAPQGANLCTTEIHHMKCYELLTGHVSKVAIIPKERC